MHNKKNNKIVLIALVLILCISIGYAFLSTVLKINSSLSLNKIAFDIHFDNVGTLTSKATVSEDAHLTNDDKNIISFSATLAEVGDYYRFTTDIVNDSTIPGKLKSVNLTGLSDSQRKLITYSIKYTNNGKEVNTGDYIKQNNSKNITVELKYKLDSNITNDDIPTDNITLDCSLEIEYENADIDELNEKMIMNQISEGVDFYPTNLVNFSRAASSSDPGGLYIYSGTENDVYPVYFYRGGNAAVHNHLIFANKCWRIIRTTSTGGTKIIYNGVPNDSDQCLTLTGPETGISVGVFSNGTTSDWNGSNIKEKTGLWYYNNIKDYSEYIEDTHFCQDNQYTNGRISLDCDEENEISVANGKNDYPIGLITAEEATLTGLVFSEYTSYSWLLTNQNFFTISKYENRGNTLWYIYNGKLADSTIAASPNARPVISLNNEVTIVSGNGTKENPYRVDLI